MGRGVRGRRDGKEGKERGRKGEGIREPKHAAAAIVKFSRFNSKWTKYY